MLCTQCGNPYARAVSKTAETTVSCEKIADDLIKIIVCKIRPKRFGEAKLRISGLPEQEVGKAYITARAHDKIGIGGFVRIELARKIVFGNLALPFRDQRVAGVNDLRARAICHCRKAGREKGL